MSDFLDRLKDEQAQLVDKITNLETFLQSETFNTLSGDNQLLLEKQHIAMSTYENILAQRLALNSR